MVTAIFFLQWLIRYSAYCTSTKGGICEGLLVCVIFPPTMVKKLHKSVLYCQVCVIYHPTKRSLPFKELNVNY